MSLESTISDITQRLRQGSFPNEQAISQGVVLRILQELEWNTWDTNLIWPEYRTEEGRADFALCHPPKKPAIFIEVKHPGKADKNAVVQALQYAFTEGVPFVILTDGRTWSFYLPAEQGSYEDRRVYKLDLFEQNAVDAAKALSRYLKLEKVESGDALETARSEYRSRNRRFRARASIPEAWNELVARRENSLIDILASAVESKIGIRPEESDVIHFLAKLSGTLSAAPILYPEPPQIIQLPSKSTFTPAKTTEKQNREITILGKKYFCSSAMKATILILNELAERDATFLERCYAHPKNRGRTRTYIARSPEEIYPANINLRSEVAELIQGWLVTTNLSNQSKKKILRMACEVAGVKFGTDIIIDF